MIESYTVTELSLFDDDDDEERVRLTSTRDDDYPLELAAFKDGDDEPVLDEILSRSKCRELRDFLNSLDLD